MTAEDMSLKEYVEGRFNRLCVDIDEKLKVQIAEVRDLILNNDLRYQQRFEAQGKELDKAFNAAKEAVGQALQGADKAASKTEQAADKRFADLGELIKEQFKGITEKYEAIAKKVGEVEARLNTHIDIASGGDKSKESTRGLWAMIIAAGAVLLSLWKIFK